MLCIFSFIYADSNGIWTYPEDIKAGVFGARENLAETEYFTFNNEVYFNKDIELRSNLIIGDEGHIISQNLNSLVLFPNRMGSGSFRIRSHENGANLRTDFIIDSSGNSEMHGNLRLAGGTLTANRIISNSPNGNVVIQLG